MKKSLKLFLISIAFVLTLLGLHGCKVPGMHQPEIEQGNIVTQKMVDRLRFKMTKAQVEFVLGRPVYQNTFDSNRWDYVYTRESRTGERVRRILTLEFEDDVLVRLSGDFRPEGDSLEGAENLSGPPEQSDSDDEVDADEEVNRSNDVESEEADLDSAD